MCHPTTSADDAGEPVVTESVEVPLGGGEGMPALLSVPDGTAPTGAAVLITDIYGPNAFYRGLSRRLAAAGLATLVPDVFFREGPLVEETFDAAIARRCKLDERRALNDLDAAVVRASELTDVRTLTGVIGFCLGGSFALNVAARRDDVAVVSFYGFPKGSPPRTSTSAPAPIDEAAEMRGPILGFFGEDDQKVPLEDVQELGRRLTAAGVPHALTTYPSLGHGFMTQVDDPDRTDAASAWATAVAFLAGEHPLRRASGA